MRRAEISVRMRPSAAQALLEVLGFVGAIVMRVRPIRRFWQTCERVPPFLAASFSSQGLGSHSGRVLIWGKARRIFISFSPPLARYLQTRYGLTGGCQSCGSSCKLLFQCPHWDDSSGLCTVYEDRPNICRLFPITPTDIRDRSIAARGTSCGFNFKALGLTPGNDVK